MGHISDAYEANQSDRYGAIELRQTKKVERLMGPWPLDLEMVCNTSFPHGYICATYEANLSFRNEAMMQTQ